MNPAVTKALFIVNKHAGTGYQPQLEGRILDHCARHDVECTIEFTRDRGHATELSREAPAKGFHWVIAAGGDGTINEVAQGMVNTSIPMGILPRGSGNGLARHLGIPLKTPDAIASLFQSEPLAMDTFTVNGKLSLNVSGVGFDGHIANLFGSRAKRGLAGYVSLTLQEFVNFMEFDAEIDIGEKRISRKAFVIAVANSSQYGNNARIAPLASVRDGLLDITIVKKVPVYRMDFVYAIFNGNVQKSALCEVYQAASLQIKTPRPMPYHVDGEPCGHHDTFDIRVLPGALKVLVPTRTKRTV